MALTYIQPKTQVRKVAKLLRLAANRVKTEEMPESLESSPEIGESALEISPPSVITVSRRRGSAGGGTDCNDDTRA
ncbi:hypothetical protein LF1_05680 [Rubripirellula obstinata]|uniref:Uncharacterized protein n=1 Tax=Rubripirellula obstinata TaxID=406547 RepID=A0A5B1CF12_9BACT|nr:hypothetical protein LF1_05680 [Rubripirellula obstinata]